MKRIPILIAAIFCACLVLALYAQAAFAGDVYYVMPESDPPRQTHDGTSWSTAYTGIQSALNVASSGDEVWVAAGSYGDIYYIPAGVKLFGGFAGTESSRDDRDWTTNQTVVTGGSFDASNAGGIVIDGFKLSHVWNIYCSGDVTFSHNVVTGSFASDDPIVMCSGPAKVINNLFYGNEVIGSPIINCSSDQGDPVIANNTMAGNTGEYYAAIECTGGSPEISNNIIAFNEGSGISVCCGGTPVLSHNCVYDNDDGNYSGITPTSDINVDPLFADSVNNDYHLASNSPCIDTGDDNEVQSGWRDMDDEPRQVDIDGVGTTNVKVDIGADERYFDYINIPVVDQSLPATGLNAGPDRCNIKWANATVLTVGYGDDFKLPAGPNWVVDKLTVWVVPNIPAWPTYFMGDHYQSVTLYGGAVGSALSSVGSGTFSTGSSETNNPDISITAVNYAGDVKYLAADGSYQQMWRVDFNDPDWVVTGGTSYAFGVMGVPRVDRLWFNHATHWSNQGDGLIREFDSSNLTAGSTTVNCSGWFGGKGSDINVQIFAHPE